VKPAKEKTTSELTVL